jgi:hypothetical protein
MDDEVSVEELQKALEHLHGVPATFVEAVDVDERSRITRAERRTPAPARTAPQARRTFRAVLGVPPVDSAVMAVRASISANQKKTQS